MFQKFAAVDDDPISLKFLRRVLEMQGYEVWCFQDGAECYQAFEEGLEVDLIITDYMMPSMNGRDLINNIKSLGDAYQKLPIIVQSALVGFNEINDLLNDDIKFIAKPIKKEELKKLIQEFEDTLL